MRAPAPHILASHFKAGRALQKQGRKREAQEHYLKLLAVAPNMAEARFQLARLQVEQEEYIAALKNLKVARRVAPAQIPIWNVTLEALENLSQKEMTLALIKEVNSYAFDKESKARLRIRIAKVLEGQNAEDEVIALCKRALSQLPNEVYALEMIARAQVRKGNLAAATGAYEESLKINSKSSLPYLGLSSVRNLNEGHPHFDSMRALIDDPSVTESQRVDLNFALGKGFDDIQDYDQAFEHYKLANDGYGVLKPYDQEKAARSYDAVLEAHLTQDWSDPSSFGPEDETPIFVTGLARSGTSLVEQILSRHPDVSSAGENNWFRRTQNKILDPLFTEGVADPAMVKSVIPDMGRDYLARARLSFPKAKRITDKTIFNFRYLGLISAALPNARIIVLRRDHRDTAVSCYRNVLTTKWHRYASDLGHLGANCRQFDANLDAWKPRLLRPIHEVSYAELTTNPEPTIRKMLEYCNLEWDDRVLHPEKSKYGARTLSSAEVRKPISSESNGTWKRYEKHLKPLFDALGEK